MGWNGVPNSESTPYVETPKPLFAFCTSFYVFSFIIFFYWTIHLLKYYQQDKNECFSHHVEGRATHQPIQPKKTIREVRSPPPSLQRFFPGPAAQRGAAQRPVRRIAGRTVTETFAVPPK